MTVIIDTLKSRAHAALADQNLQHSLGALKNGFVKARARAVLEFPDFEMLRKEGATIKDNALANLDTFLEQFEREVKGRGGFVHWARDAPEARRIIQEICRRSDAKTVTKGKSMVTEEIALNEVLEADGIEVVETDAGEYIIQLAKETPSHIVMPTLHKSVDQISSLFERHHAQYGFEKTTDPAALIGQIRAVLRKKFFTADVGITGANFLIAETGSGIIVTNEGNGDLTSTLARVHVVVSGIEKIVPTLDDAAVLLRLLARSALGIDFTTYVTLLSGARQARDVDGPEEFHVVLVDNGRSKMLSSAYRPMLRCIRCGACMNHCPVYMAVGGHAYGWIYPGPMGSVLTPMIAGHEKGGELPHACTLNGHCEQVCPVKIPLPDMLRRLRHEQWDAELTRGMARYGIKLWAWVAARPALYRLISAVGVKLISVAGAKRGYLRRLPFGGGWTAHRDFPAPQGRTFFSQWSAEKKHAR